MEMSLLLLFSLLMVTVECVTFQILYKVFSLLTSKVLPYEDIRIMKILLGKYQGTGGEIPDAVGRRV